MIPLTEKEIRISIVEIINPEFLITLWNSSVWKNENNNNMTSAIIRILKNCSKKILFISLNEMWLVSIGWIIPIPQSKNEYIAVTSNIGTKAVAILFLSLWILQG